MLVKLILKHRPTVVGCVHVLSQPLSTSVYETKPQKISDNISFRPAGDISTSSERPMALVLSWLLSKSKHIYKYGDYYLGHNFDVLHVKVDPKHLLWPRNTHKLVDTIEEFLGHPDRQQQKVLIHGFSVGAYVLGELLVALENGEDKGGLRNRFTGMVFDSPVLRATMCAEGTSKAVTNNPILQQSLQGLVNTYLAATDNHVAKYYRRVEETFFANRLNLPAHFLYSEVDPVGNAKTIEEITTLWQSRGLPVTGKCWPDSAHVSHFHRYPVEYTESLTTFLQSLNHIPLPQQELERSKKTAIAQ